MRTRPPRLANFSIRTECDGQVAVLAYDRPESGNSLHPTMLQVSWDEVSERYGDLEDVAAADSCYRACPMR
jgi:hypothetical protein